MLFYVLFAAGLALPARWTLPAVTVALASLVAAETFAGPLPLPFGFWGQPIVLEFAAGMGLAVLRRKGLRLPGVLRVVVAAIGRRRAASRRHICRVPTGPGAACSGGAGRPCC